MKSKRLVLSLLLLLTLALGSAYAGADEAGYENVQVLLKQEFGVSGSYVVYPVLSDPLSRESVALVNKTIEEKAQIADYLRVLGTVTEGSVGLTVDCDCTQDVSKGIFSVVLSASGKMPQGRPAQKYYAMTFDLATGEEISFDRLFTDANAALEQIERLMDEQVSDILSTYMENSALTPVPTEHFAVLHDAVTFYYDEDQLSFLSGDSGAVSFWYYELAPYLDLSASGVAARLKTAESAGVNDDEQRAQTISDLAAHGVMPGLNVGLGAANETVLSIGTDVSALTDAFKQTTDSGYYPGGAYIEVEYPLLRGTYILTNEAGEKVTGFVCSRLDMFGIQTGVTTAQEWRALLGQPQSTETLDAAEAESLLLPAGTSDVYAFGNPDKGLYTLTLHADDSGVLRAVILKKD